MRAWLVLILIAGCIQAGSDTVPDDPAAPEAPAAADAPPVLPDAEATLADLADFVERAPRRFDNQEDHDTARGIIEAHYEDLGLKVTRHTFTGPAQDPTRGEVEGQNILAVLPGKQAGRVLMFGGHYDSAFNGYGGAYDDGLGTFIALGLARAMAHYEWEHTLVFAAWDQEEAGLVGSRAYAAQMHEGNASLSLFVNFDMTGISWPAKWLGAQDIPIKADFGGPSAEQFVAWWDMAREDLGYPSEATRTGAELGPGSSDHGAFRELDLPAAWVRGAVIGNYPSYHNVDTVETMVANVGGDRADLVAGIDATMQMVFRFAVLVDGSIA